MTERASPLPAAHRVSLDCACDGAAYTCDGAAYTCDRAAYTCDRAAYTCDRAAYTCDKSNGFISPHTITYYRPSPPLHPVYGKATTGRGALRGT